MLTRRESLQLLLGALIGACGGQLRAGVRASPLAPAEPEPALAIPPVHPAIGDLRDVPRGWRGVYTTDEYVPRLPAPEPGEWLAEHYEPGQTFDDYVAQRPNRPDGPRRFIYLLPLGGLESAHAPDLELLRAYESTYFGVDTRLLPTLSLGQLPVTRRINSQTHKEQLLTSDILDQLRPRVPADACCVLGLTLADLYPKPSWNFVFGQARLKERVGVYSLIRNHPGFHGEPEDDTTALLVLRRSLKMMTHETGHLLGIRHCTYYRCFINGANHLPEADACPPHACPVCLRKLEWALRFNPLERYQRLRRFYGEHGLAEEAAWITRRLEAVARAAT